MLKYWLAAAIVLSLFGQSTLTADLVINEARIDQPSADNDEYFELYADGESFSDLSTFFYIVIGDGSAGSGVVENVTQLSGGLNNGGFLLVAEDNDTFGASADIIATLGFENSDNVTHMLVENFTGSNGDDLDTDDDGNFDSTPWSSILDSFALTSGLGDQIYSSTVLGPVGGFAPGHVYRDVNGTAGTWQIGAFNPVGGDDTPGASNAIPEPGAFGLLALGLIGWGARRRRETAI